MHSAVDGNTRLGYTEVHDDETAATAIDFMNNTRMLFATHGINRIERVIIDNGPFYLARRIYQTLEALYSAAVGA